MPGARTFMPLVPTALVIAGLVSGCDARRIDTETAAVATAGSSAGSRTDGADGSAAVPISTASDEARRLYLEGRGLTEQLRAHDGREKLEQAVAADPSFPLGHYQLAANAASAKDFFAHLKEAKALADKASEGERLMILALEAGGNADPTRQLAYQRELVAKYPGDERAHFLLGGGYFGQQEYDSAIGQYTRATEINPRFSPAYNLLGYAYRAVERYDDAETAFKKYIELIPGDPNPYDSYAELLMKTGRFDESIGQYQKALSVDQHFSPSRVGIATNLMLQGKPDAAAAKMDELYQRARDNADRRTALFVKSVILTDAGRTDAAVREIEREYALDARLADTANMSGDAQLTGNILLDAGRTAQAAKRFHQALDLVERSSLSDDVKQDTKLADRYNQGRIALAGGDLAQARTEATAYAAGASQRQNSFRLKQAHQLEGQIALAAKDYDAALSQLGQANQQDPQVLYLTALAYQGKGDTTKVRELAAKAANANILPLASYAFVRAKARKLAA
jgi:tetratricopeptide (TPR) repeat protein